MLKKTITYDDLDGNKITEDFYFALNKAELAEMRLRQGEGFDGFLKSIVDARDGNQLMDLFKSMLRMSVGKRASDGKRFIKNDDIRDEFMQSDAYSVLFMELVTDAVAAGLFVRGLVPAELSGQVSQALAESSPDLAAVMQPAVNGLQNDQAVQAAKPQPTGLPEPTPFPQSLEGAIVTQAAEPTTGPSTPSGSSSANAANPEDEDPIWYKEGRYPNKKELMAMGTEEMQFAMKLRSAKAFG